MIDHTDAGDVPAPGEPGGGEEVLHYLHDALGSVVALTDAAGAVVEQYTYVEGVSDGGADFLPGFWAKRFSEQESVHISGARPSRPIMRFV